MAISRSLDKMHRSKEGDLTKSNQFWAYPSQLHELEGFNPRNYDRPEVQTHIRNLAEAYKAGRVVPPPIVQVIDGKIFIRDGYCRRRGMLLAIEEGAELGKQPLIEFKGDENEADALVLTSQSNEKLTALEVAMMYHRMTNRGKTEAEIAEVVGRTPQHVRMLLEVHTLPLEIKDLIERGVVSWSFALSTYNQNGTAAIEMLKEGVEIVLKSGKGNGKLTEKKLEAIEAEKKGSKPAATRSKRISKKVITSMSSQIFSLADKIEQLPIREDGSATVELTQDEVNALLELRHSLPPQEGVESQEAAGADQQSEKNQVEQETSA
jgi:predicted transcriptional regulator